MRLFIYKLLFTIVFAGSAYSQSMMFLSSPENKTDHWMFRTNIDSISGNWLQLSPMPTPLYGVSTYYLTDSNKIFVCGGSTSSATVSSCYFFNPNTNQYETKSQLPIGRALGKLVRVRDSLYLVGSVGSSFFTPDGITYKYDIKANTWQQKAATPNPYLIESAVCVYKDTLIITIGGSTSAYTGATNIVRIYNTISNTWTVAPGTSNFPLLTTTGHAECFGSEVVVVGGFGTTFNRPVYRGSIDTATVSNISWRVADTLNPYGVGVYRVGGGKWNNYMFIGPALRNSTIYNTLFVFNIADSSWKRLTPNTIDTAGNRPTIAVKPESDSIYLYLFGGILNTTLAITPNGERYAYGNPIIGISGNQNQSPSGFALHQNYPNPFNPSTKISYDVPDASFVTIIIFDALGRQVFSKAMNHRSPGKYEISFDASRLSSGIYFCQMTAGEGFRETKSMIFIK